MKSDGDCAIPTGGKYEVNADKFEYLLSAYGN